MGIEHIAYCQRGHQIVAAGPRGDQAEPTRPGRPSVARRRGRRAASGVRGCGVGPRIVEGRSRQHRATGRPKIRSPTTDCETIQLRFGHRTIFPAVRPPEAVKPSPGHDASHGKLSYDAWRCLSLACAAEEPRAIGDHEGRARHVTSCHPETDMTDEGRSRARPRGDLEIVAGAAGRARCRS